MKHTIHLLPSAHLDPVWLWDWREGLNEAEATIIAVLDLMDEYSSLTFNRGEVQIYEHIQKKRPDLFKRILALVEQGRWDVVGGTYIQPDANLSSTETICRHFEWGLDYFKKEMGVRPVVSWQPDSFGHPRGWPTILKSFGFEGFAFTRPLRSEFPMPEAAFFWQAQSGEELLCYRPHWRSYCNNRDNIKTVLDHLLEFGSKMPLRNLAAYMGLGNHGGGPTRRHIREVYEWAELHPEVEVRFSTHHTFFKTLMKEIKELPAGVVPVQQEEFGYCLRGCYSSLQRFKQAFRQLETAAVVTERTDALLSETASTALEPVWRSVLLNSFHDILPGSSIERAVQQQFEEVGGAIHQSRVIEYDALLAFSQSVDTRVSKPANDDQPTDTPFFVWNSQPQRFRGHVELETQLDYRPFFHLEGQLDKAPFTVRDSRGRTVAHQAIETEHHCMPGIPWRKRALVPVDLPPFGWKVLRLGLADRFYSAKQDSSDCHTRLGSRPSISNASWEVTVSLKSGLAIKHNGENAFGSTGLGLITVKDIYGSWGGMKEEPEAWKLDDILARWKVTAVAILEEGPERAVLWTRWEGGQSQLDLTFSLYRNTDTLGVTGRLLWNERSARLQLVIPAKGDALCDVTGGVATRKERGQVPVGRWFTRQNMQGDCVGVATDVLSDADFLKKETRLTLARATRYGDDVPTQSTEDIWRPATDRGELKFKLQFFGVESRPDAVVESLLCPPVVMPVAATAGPLPSEGSIGELKPVTARLLALGRMSDGKIRIRVQNRGTRKMTPRISLFGKQHTLEVLLPHQICTYYLKV